MINIMYANVIKFVKKRKIPGVLKFLNSVLRGPSF